MHRVAQQQAFSYATFIEAFLDLAGDVDQFPSAGGVEPELFSVAFHGDSLQVDFGTSFIPRHGSLVQVQPLKNRLEKQTGLDLFAAPADNAA
jgi:hypothetical protein